MIKKGVVFFASGNGSNVEAILKAMKQKSYPAFPVAVCCNNPNAGVLKIGEKYKVPTRIINKESFSDTIKFINNFNVDEAIICLAGFTKIIPPSFIKEYYGRIINIHPSLLPKFGGKGMYGIKVHESVINAKEDKTGVTVHFVDKGIDTGEIILQDSIDVMKTDTPETLQKKVLKLEHVIYPKAIKILCKNYLN